MLTRVLAWYVTIHSSLVVDKSYCRDNEKLTDPLTMLQVNIAGDVIALQNYFSDQLQAAKGSIAHAAYRGVASAASKVAGSYGQ